AHEHVRRGGPRSRAGRPKKRDHRIWLAAVAALTVLYALWTLVPTGTGTTLTSSLGGWATGAVAAAASASLLYAARRRASAFEDAGLEPDGAYGPAALRLLSLPAAARSAGSITSAVTGLYFTSPAVS